MKRIMFLMTLAVLLFNIGAAQAQTGGDYNLTWWTVDGGGAAASGGNYALAGTTGQPDTGAALSGGDYILVGGFWPAASSGGVLYPYNVYLPLIIK